MQKGSFLGAKRSPFTMQNESFWNAKGLVLKISCSNFENQLYNKLKKEAVVRLHSGSQSTSLPQPRC